MTSSAEVDNWFATSDHPRKELMQAVRRLILEADVRVTETIKWKTPTFVFNGNIASFNPQAKAFVGLMFHRGADIPGNFPSIQGGGDVARYMRIEDEADLKHQTSDLQGAVRAWCEMKAKK
jgi:hypothetical protein